MKGTQPFWSIRAPWHLCPHPLVSVAAGRSIHAGKSAGVLTDLSKLVVLPDVFSPHCRQTGDPVLGAGVGETS